MTSTPLGSARVDDLVVPSDSVDARRPAFVDGTRRLDRAELAARVLACAARLDEVGIRSGDRVAILLDDPIELAVAALGAMAAGGVCVPIATTLPAARAARILTSSNARVLVTESRLGAALPSEALAPMACVEPNDAPTAAFERRSRGPGGDAPAAIVHGPAVTGRPRGVILSHANLVAGARILARHLDLRRDERALLLEPFASRAGLTHALAVLAAGGAIYLERSTRPGDLCRALKSYEITFLAGTATDLTGLLARSSPAWHVDVPCLRGIACTGVAPADALARYRARARDLRVHVLHGSDEAFPALALPPHDLDRAPASLGRPVSGVDAAVVGESGEPPPPGAMGELVLRGPTVALGWDDDAAGTADAFESDRADPRPGARVFRSGELVRRDERGLFHACGHRDAIIQCHGHRVSPVEIEAALLASGLLADVAVRGVPDGVAGARLEAHVVPRERRSFESAQLLAHCRRVLPPHVLPRAVVVHETLPRAANGAVDRAALAALPGPPTC